MDWKSEKEVMELCDTGKKLYVQCGFAYKGANPTEATKEDVLRAHKWGFGPDVRETDDAIYFTYYSEGDMW